MTIAVHARMVAFAIYCLPTCPYSVMPVSTKARPVDDILDSYLINVRGKSVELTIEASDGGEWRKVP